MFGETAAGVQGRDLCAISLVYPDFCLEEGNHNIGRTITAPPETVRPKLPLLHLPIRSASRFKYKMVNASRLLDSKHSAEAEEGHHVETILRRLEAEQAAPDLLTSLVQTYGLKEGEAAGSAHQPSAKAPGEEALRMVKRQLPAYVREAPAHGGEARSLKETLERDAQTPWERALFGAGAPVTAEINGAEIVIRCQPRTGRGHAFYGRYSGLAPAKEGEPAGLSVKVLTDTIAAALGDLPLKPESDWTGLHPALFALFSLLRPRRYVGLGVHSGASIFAACQASENLDLETQCVAVDAWIDDGVVFEQFRRQLEEKFRTQKSA